MSTPTVLLVLREGGQQTTLLELDAALSEAHTFEQEVTEHPVEESSPVADHVRAKPRPLTLEGMVSNSPLRSKAELQGLDLAPSRGGQLAGRLSTAYAALLSLEGKTVDVVTSLEVYRDMALRRLDIPRNAGIGDVLHFTASFIAIRRVSSLTVPIVKTATTKGQPRGNLGAQPAKAAEEATVNRSILSELDSEHLGGFLHSLGRGQ